MNTRKIKFATYRSQPDLSWMMQTSLALCADKRNSGIHFKRFKSNNKTPTHMIEHHVAGEHSTVIKVGQQLLESFAMTYKFDCLLVGHCHGKIKENEILYYVIYGSNEEKPYGDALDDLCVALDKNLPFSITETYNTNENESFTGDIVAMNRSTLRGIIANDHRD